MPKRQKNHAGGKTLRSPSGRTCIVVDGQAIRLQTEEPLYAEPADTCVTEHGFSPIDGYPVSRAAALYVSYAKYIGATEEAIELLGRLTNLNKEDYTMAAKRATAKKATAKKATAKKATAKKATTGERKPSAAGMFRDLIHEGKLTDDEIFAAVQKEFGLDDKKRTYVAWYRNYMRKHGEAAPGPVEG